MATKLKRTVKAKQKPKAAPAKPLPKQDRARETYDRLLDVAAQLLAEVGIERISTNMICARAGLTPPALYRYFKDKYAILEALGMRLMERQNVVLEAWLKERVPKGLPALQEGVEDLMRATAKVTAAEPGAIWILRALRAVPQLAHVRIDSHRYVSDMMADLYAPLLPDMPRDLLWMRIRLSIELGYAVDEMLAEEEAIPRDAVLHEAARLLKKSVWD